MDYKELTLEDLRRQLIEMQMKLERGPHVQYRKETDAMYKHRVADWRKMVKNYISMIEHQIVAMRYENWQRQNAH